jgi:hypothetical protein
LFSELRRFGRERRRFLWRRLSRTLSRQCFDGLNGTRSLCRFRIGFSDTLPQASERVGAGLWGESLIGTESLHNGLDHFFLNLIGTSIPFPIIKHFRESADDGIVTVSVLMFETEKFTQFFK